MYSAVENDTQCVPVCNRWRLKAEYHVERSGNSMPRGRILELKNNYGIIDTDQFKSLILHIDFLSYQEHA